MDAISQQTPRFCQQRSKVADIPTGIIEQVICSSFASERRANNLLNNPRWDVSNLRPLLTKPWRLLRYCIHVGRHL